MVNPLMSSSKQEPFSTISDVLGASSSAQVKMELMDNSENGDEDDTKIEVKMEVLEEFFGLGFGGNIIDNDSKEALIGSESLLIPLGPPPNYPGPDMSSTHLVKTVKVPLSSSVSEGSFPPVLSIPGSASTTFSLASPSSLQISVSPSQGPDTTTLTSPPPSASSSSSSHSVSASKKNVFTAKGLLLFLSYRESI